MQHFRHPEDPPPRLAAWLLPATMAVAGGLVAACGAARPLDGEPAAGVFPPWWSQARILTAAARAGAIVSIGAVPFVVVVQAPGAPLPDRLRDAGALFSLHPGGAAPCGT